MHCRFLSNDETLEGHIVRLLEIKCKNGFVGQIYVTREESFSIPWKDGHVTNTWHYELSNDKKFITLSAKPTSSVKFMGINGNELCHENIINWSLI